MSKNINTAISNFSHEIKNPLHSAAINLEVLRARLAKSTMREAKELLKHAEIIDKDLRSLQQIVEKFILDISKSKWENNALLLRCVRQQRSDVLIAAIEIYMAKFQIGTIYVTSSFSA